MKKIHYKNEKAIVEACTVIKNGGVIVYPTDTLYGFGCDAKNETAIQKINSIKGRISPISVIAPNIKAVAQWMNIPEFHKTEILDILSESQTVIAPVKENIVSTLILGKGHSLGIRIPNHPFCQQLSNAYPNPITTTSVNRTEQSSMTNPNLIQDEFETEINLIIDGGIIDGNGSSIFQYTNGELAVIRV